MIPPPLCVGCMFEQLIHVEQQVCINGNTDIDPHDAGGRGVGVGVD